MERILFVDDEPNVLKGIQRLLHSMRERWQMDFANDAQEALSKLSTQEYDVVVSDMRMPGMDGAMFLSEVMEKYPSTIRFILSGQADENAIIRCVGKTHQFLSKPCDADTMINAILRACKLRDILSNNRLKHLVSKIQVLPGIPEIYDQLRKELVKEDCSIKAITNIVSKDIGMTAKLLQLVNSAFFGLRQQVTNAEQAVAYLGSGTISALVLSQKLFEDTGHIQNRATIERLQEHAITTASISRDIAKNLGLSKDMVEECFAAGLLHDIGVLIFVTYWDKPYAAVLKKARQDQMPLYHVEHEMLGTTHCEIGAYLLGLWGLPHRIVESVAFHHEPERLQAFELGPLATVHVADFLSHENSPTDDFHAGAYLSSKYLEQLNISDKIDLWRELAIEREPVTV